MNTIASLDLNLLVVFDAILRERNITQAALRVGLSQPATSSALGRLRKVFNDPLFVRTRNGMQPTPYAQLLASPIQRACELIAATLQVGAVFDPATSTRTFNFYMTDIGEAVFLPKLLGAIVISAPRVKIKVARMPERGAREALAEGEVDIAIGLFPDLKAGFFQQRLYRDEFVCIVRADRDDIPPHLGLKQFAAMRHAVVATTGTGHEAAVERAFAKQKLRRRIDLVIPHFMALPIIVAQTDVIATVPRRLALAFEGYPDLKIIAPPIRIPTMEIKQHWHERFHHAAPSKWMRRTLAGLLLE
ncbi:MAG: LysR family transcriptional regulator [Casimicrobiaceae bacterium]